MKEGAKGMELIFASVEDILAKILCVKKKKRKEKKLQNRVEGRDRLKCRHGTGQMMGWRGLDRDEIGGGCTRADEWMI